MTVANGFPRLRLIACLMLIATARPIDGAAGNETMMTIRDDGSTLKVRRGNRPVATYDYANSDILRPFFANVHSLDGVKATRNFPPIPGTDAIDHATMHPGIWLAFGDISGVDFWRNQGRVKHLRFTEGPSSRPATAGFAEHKQYIAPDGSIICDERFRCEFHATPDGLLITLDSTFSSDDEFYFGDQEEMGLGIRVATPITQRQGGRIEDSAGRQGADQVWSQASQWCGYRGRINEQTVGITILCHPQNFRASWMHARDYGLIAANPFGRAAMRKGPADKTVVRPGSTLRLRYGVFVHSGTVDATTAYPFYLATAGTQQ